MVKTDSSGTAVRVVYDTANAGDGNYLLQRKVFIPADSTTPIAISPIGNTDRGYVRNGDFAVTVTAAGKVVGQVNIAYKIRRNATDTVAAMVQTTIHPLNNLIAVQ